jgi:hypothetical protein
LLSPYSRVVATYSQHSHQLWEKAEPARVAEVEVLVLGPEDTILHLCLHAAYHHAFDWGVRYLLDLTQVIEHFESGIDWGLCCSRAQRAAWRLLTRQPQAIESAERENELRDWLGGSSWPALLTNSRDRNASAC